MITEKIEKTREILREQMEKAKAPAILYSGGKDSQALLWLLRDLGYGVPVIHLRSLYHPTKHAFADRMIDEWNLTLSGVPMVGIDVVAKGTDVNLVEEYRVSPDFFLYLPFENEPGREFDAETACGVDVLNRKHARRQPAPAEPLHDVIFIGHRYEDGDGVFGHLPVKEYASTQNGLTMVYPLRDWSEADIWEASNLYDIPQNDARYAGDMSANSDYFNICTKCFQPGADTVFCPKVQGEVHNLGNVLNLDARREAWRSSFINIEETDGNNSKSQTACESEGR